MFHYDQPGLDREKSFILLPLKDLVEIPKKKGRCYVLSFDESFL